MQRVEELPGRRVVNRGAGRRKNPNLPRPVVWGKKVGLYKSARQLSRVAKRAKACRTSAGAFARILLAVTSGLFLPFAVHCQENSQDSGSREKEFFGNGVEISVTVHDDSGVPIPSPATVQLFRGTIPSGRAQTSRGVALLVVNGVGEFTVSVQAPGFREGREELSVRAEGKAQVDVYLRRLAREGGATGVAARPILAPKAKEALDKGLMALSADKINEAEKQIGQAMTLAPGHPDVLYAQGVLRIKQQNFVEAQSALEKATQVDPNHGRAFAALGMALCDQGKYDAAIAPLEKSLRLDSLGAWETRWALAKAYYQLGRYDAALKMSKDALAGANEREPRIVLLVAQSLTAVGEYEEAARTLREFVRDHGEGKEAATARRWLESLTRDGKIQPAKD